MTPRKEPWTFDEVSVSFVAKAANYVTSRFGRYVERSDVQSEMTVWLFANRAKVEDWLAATPQRTTIVYRRLLDAGLSYANAEKAQKVGYHPDDVYWFTANVVKGLMPLVLDATYVRPKGQIDDLMAMVFDIRRVMTDEERLFFLDNAPEGALAGDYAQNIVNRLGGEGRTRRRRVSNAQAQAMTREQS